MSIKKALYNDKGINEEEDITLINIYPLNVGHLNI